MKYQVAFAFAVLLVFVTCEATEEDDGRSGDQGVALLASVPIKWSAIWSFSSEYLRAGREVQARLQYLFLRAEREEDRRRLHA